MSVCVCFNIKQPNFRDFEYWYFRIENLDLFNCRILRSLIIKYNFQYESIGIVKPRDLDTLTR